MQSHYSSKWWYLWIFDIVNSFKYDNENKGNGNEYRHHIDGLVQENITP